MIRINRRLFKTEHDLVRESLSAYLDDELGERDRSRVERHLQSCPACRAELAALRQTADLLHLLPEVPLPRSFLVPVAEGRALASQRQPAFGAMRLASVMATFLFVIALSGNLLLQSGLGGMTSAPAPQAVAIDDAMVEKEMVVLETVVVEKEMVVLETVVVEKEVEVEKEAVAAQQLASPQIAAIPRTASEEVTAKALAEPDRQPLAMEKAAVLETLPPPLEKEAALALTAPETQTAPSVDVMVKSAREAPQGIETASQPVETVESLPEPTGAAVLSLKAVETPAPGASAEVAAYAGGESVDAAGQPQAEALDRPSPMRQARLQPILDGLMWALLVVTVLLWAGTAALSKRRR